jgi:hypothetical protein
LPFVGLEGLGVGSELGAVGVEDWVLEYKIGAACFLKTFRASLASKDFERSCLKREKNFSGSGTGSPLVILKLRTAFLTG